jgi:hypothetical protein
MKVIMNGSEIREKSEADGNSRLGISRIKDRLLTELDSLPDMNFYPKKSLKTGKQRERISEKSLITMNDKN